MGYCADLVDKNFFVPAEYAGKVMKKMNDYGYSVEPVSYTHLTLPTT